MALESYKGKASALERKIADKWEQTGIFKWNAKLPRSETFVVDTPPPTVSGSLHMGHVFSYTQTDLIVRYQRMKGKNIFYPMGWDDNGLPTERRVQNYFGIRCDGTLPVLSDWEPQKNTNRQPVAVSRTNFIEACERLTQEDEKAFEALYRRLGLSVDWTLQYSTMGELCRKISQRSFLDLVNKGCAYSRLQPFMWDVDFQTAIAQAEVEDREMDGFFCDLRFGVEGGGEFTIATTRPELLPACIAIVAHPDDDRYQRFFGKKAFTPLFGAPVPISPSTHVDPKKGTGIMMICTFGDSADVQWWKESGAPLRQIIGVDGRMLPVSFGLETFLSSSPKRANEQYAQLHRLTISQARRKIIELLAEAGSGPNGEGTALVGKPRPIKHSVKFFEKGERPIEFIPTRQWFINVLAHKEALLEQGRKIAWHPDFMKSRYEHWVQGLSADWCISRQRFFGVPFPVWYPISDKGVIEYDRPIFSSEENLPVDPLVTAPPGYKESQRDQPGGFCGDKDVMDTWATSSLTPQISSHWGISPDRHDKVFPADIRPQGHEIIRTWAFYTIAKAYFHQESIPWKHVVVSGWILDPDRKKMSKSKGNVVTPEALLDEYSSDAVRYWAARARLGVDTAFDENLFKIGKKLLIKLQNSSKFVLSHFQREGILPEECRSEHIITSLDHSFISGLKETVQSVTKAFDQFDYALALQLTEESFWDFCDNYLELVKKRAYGPWASKETRSALATLSLTLSTYNRLFAPHLPFTTEALWSELYGERRGSVHTSSWPSVTEYHLNKSSLTDRRGYEEICKVVRAVRSFKSTNNLRLGAPIEHLIIKANPKWMPFITSASTDIAACCVVPDPEKMQILTNGECESFEIEVS